jgi:hypothetical protein
MPQTIDCLSCDVFHAMKLSIEKTETFKIIERELKTLPTSIYSPEPKPHLY